MIELETEWHRLRLDLERAREYLKTVQANERAADLSADAAENKSETELDVLDQAYLPSRPDRGRGRVFFAGAAVTFFFALGVAGARVLLNDTLYDGGDIHALGGPALLAAMPELPARPPLRERTIVPAYYAEPPGEPGGRHRAAWRGCARHRAARRARARRGAAVGGWARHGGRPAGSGQAQSRPARRKRPLRPAPPRRTRSGTASTSATAGGRPVVLERARGAARLRGRALVRARRRPRVRCARGGDHRRGPRSRGHGVFELLRGRPRPRSRRSGSSGTGSISGGRASRSRSRW